MAPYMFEVDIKATKSALLAQEDTDRDGKITTNDKGARVRFRPQRWYLGLMMVQITGTYHLANLLQELALAEAAGLSTTTIKGTRIAENPVDRIRRRIKDEMWGALFRKLDGPTIVDVAKDPKEHAENARPRIYVPATAPEQYEYYLNVAKEYPDSQLEVHLLPDDLAKQQRRWDLRAPNGILAMHMDRDSTGRLHPLEYVVPGHRFNEFYGWDSYFCAIGLLAIGKLERAMDIAQHFIFETQHYGSVLNGNRSYYIGRSHPPFLTDLLMRIYDCSLKDRSAKEFLKRGIVAAIKEYLTIWMSPPRFDPETGLSRYRPNQRGIPPEVELGHYDWALQQYADREGMTIAELSQAYNNGTLQNAELDNFFEHDRSIRESGHDNSYRVEGQCADLATVDLNSLLYKYETDIARAISEIFDDQLNLPSDITTNDELRHSSFWLSRAAERKTSMNKYLWNDQDSMFHDYNIFTQRQTPYKAITTFWPLWSGLATPQQAQQLVTHILPLFEEIGGVASTVSQPDEPNGPAQRQRQWDHPYGWAPHQITLWDALRRYGYEAEAKRVAYKWLYLITRIAVDYNGTITEKYDVTKDFIDEGLDAEYGNQGLEFTGVPTQGFGWTNASYSYGLDVIGVDLVEKLRDGYRWEQIEGSVQKQKL